MVTNAIAALKKEGVECMVAPYGKRASLLPLCVYGTCPLLRTEQAFLTTSYSSAILVSSKREALERSVTWLRFTCRQAFLLDK